jgi:FkbM family methyltransferase
VRSAWRGRLTRLRNGVPIEVDPRDMVGSEILRQGCWEWETFHFLSAWLKPGMTFIDIGAHVGQYSLLASAAVGRAGDVHGFEPHPELYRVLRRNLRRARASNASAHRVALADRDGTRDLFLQPFDNPGATSLRPDGLAGERRVRVRATTLDGYLRAKEIPRVDLIKIDVEGAERLVLAGAAATLDANPDVVLVIEFLRSRAERFGHAIEDLEADLRASGFHLFAITRQGLRPYERVGDLSVNVVASRRLGAIVRHLPNSHGAPLLMALAAASPGVGGLRHRRATRARPRPARYVISRRSAGLGDLLVNLVAAWRFARHTGRTLVADWRSSPYLRTPDRPLFPELFEPSAELNGVPFIGDHVLDQISFPEPCHPRFWTPERLRQRTPRPAAAVEVDRRSSLGLILLGGDIRARTVVFDGCINDALPENDVCRQVLAALRPVIGLRRLVEDFRDRHFGHRPLVSVHIRHGNGTKRIGTHRLYWTDFAAAIERCRAATSLARDALGGNAAVFLSTDSGAVVDAFRQHAGEIIVRPKHIPEPDGHELHLGPNAHLTLVDAFVEMLLLAEGHALVRYPPHSFFSFYASLLKKPGRVGSDASVRDPAGRDPLAPAIVW